MNLAFSKSHVRVRSQSRKCMQSAPNCRGEGRRIGFGYGRWVGKKGVCLLRAQGLDHDEIHKDLRRKLPWAGAAKLQGHKAGSAQCLAEESVLSLGEMPSLLIKTCVGASGARTQMGASLT